MYTIRRSVFETNSSSTHSVSIRHNSKFPPDYKYSIEELKYYVENDGFFHVDLKEFGWGPDYYTDPYTKFSYLLCMLSAVNGLYTNNWYRSDEEREKDYAKYRSAFEKFPEWEMLNDFIINTLGCNGIYIDDFNGYIDHQSYEDYRSIHDFLVDYDVSLEDFIFNGNVKLIIDNDNH